MRIISLVPSLTETICDFGLQEKLVGCTSFCSEPKSLRKTVQSVGGTKDADLGRILALNPTHIIVNLEENTSGLIQSLREEKLKNNFEIIETFLEYPEDNFTTISDLSVILGFTDAAQQWIERVQDSLVNLKLKMNGKKSFRFAYFIWMHPWMVAGNHTYISRCLELIGGQNVVGTGTALQERYPVVYPTDPRISAAEFSLFSSEPFPFRNRHIEMFHSEFQNNRHSMKVDGQALSWYGSRFEVTLKELELIREKIDK